MSPVRIATPGQPQPLLILLCAGQEDSPGRKIVLEPGRGGIKLKKICHAN
jgi:hypothetical protein